jgi:hypothetical protein
MMIRDKKLHLKKKDRHFFLTYVICNYNSISCWNTYTLVYLAICSLFSLIVFRALFVCAVSICIHTEYKQTDKMVKINDQQSHILRMTKYPFVVALSIGTIYDWMTGGMSFKGVHLSCFFAPRTIDFL